MIFENNQENNQEVITVWWLALSVGFWIKNVKKKKYNNVLRNLIIEYFKILI